MAEVSNPAAPPDSSSSPVERHTSWLELFFDLVVVTAVAQLSHRLRGAHDIADVAITAAVFYAIWNVWVSFTLYANVTAAKTRTRPMLIGMFGIAVMAACIPEVTGARGTAFVVTYLICRAMAAGVFRDSQAVLLSWSVAQDSAGIPLWIASIWVHSDVRYWLWGVAILVDLVTAITIHLRPRRFLEDRSERANRHHADVHIVDVDDAHLEERLGLFVVIVLGEAVAQLVNSAAESEWERPLAAASVLGFWLLVCLWQLTVGLGSAAIPNPHRIQPPPAVLMPAHLLTTAGITAVAAGLGSIAADPGEPMSTILRWIMCGGAAAWFAARIIVGAYDGAPLGWIFGWAVPAAAGCVLVAVIGADWHGPLLVTAIAVLAAWQLLYATTSAWRARFRRATRGWTRERTES